ncbi:helix-turn-helix domain-containing protein [Alkaliphilus transvaalensis]|uniref:helix-turn-helix domain-containing protein n=1 Tax=Alkaliphilus transvaalensis TaxID=114628 RepID=UPI00047BFFFA|nr:helix-turn-helix transcriptional regulator [Alkaliphilus transvaalensis]
MTYLNSGEKIRQLRKAMDLKQDDLTSDEITKSLISMIESNKRNLTWKTAYIIARNLNKYYATLGQNITPEYLMRAEEDDARQDIRKNIDELKEAVKTGALDEKLIHHNFKQLAESIIKFNFKDELMEFKILRGTFFYNNDQYQEALKDYLDALSYANEIKAFNKVAWLHILIGKTYKMQSLVDTAIIHFIKSLDITCINESYDSEKIKAYSNFNLVICYEIKRRHDLIFSHINSFRKLNWNDPEFKIFSDRLELIEANTYRVIGNYIRAAAIYDKLLEAKGLDLETMFLIYQNYTLLALEEGNAQKGLEYNAKAKNLKEQIDISQQSALLLYEARCYNLLEKHKKVFELLEFAVKLVERVPNKHLIVDIHFALIEAFMQYKDFCKVETYLNEVEKIIFKKELKNRVSELNSYYIDYYIEIGDRKKAREYSKMIRSKNYLVP